VDAFDADALIYAAIPGHTLGERVAALFASEPSGGPGAPGAPGAPGRRVGVGSVLLLPEVLAKPMKDGDTDAVRMLSGLLGRLDLRPIDRAIAAKAAVLGARYNLRAADATHLATAISMGAHRFITNNKRDFGPSIAEIDITFPAGLPEGQG
jgi:hypothetical protein